VSNSVMAEPAAKRIANRLRKEMGRGPANRMSPDARDDLLSSRSHLAVTILVP
jgi:hypothetical protein